MTREREILNEKLQSIDHKLDVDMLWGELEGKLPPKQDRRKPVWLWFSGLLGMFLIAAIGWVVMSTSDIEQSVQSLTDAEKIEANSLVSNIASDNLMNDDQKSITESLSKNQPTNRNTTKPSSQNTTFFKENSAVSSIQNELTQSTLANSNYNVENQNPVTENQILSELVAQSPINFNTASTKQIAQSKTIAEHPQKLFSSENLESSPRNEKKPSAPVSVEKTESLKLTFPYLIPSVSAPLEYQRDIAQPTMASAPVSEAIEPVLHSKPIRAELQFAAHYGQRLGGYLPTFGVTSQAADEITDYVDVTGLQLSISYPVYKRLSLVAGINYSRYTDKTEKRSTRVSVEQSLDDPAFEINQQNVILTAFHKTDVFDFQLGANYDMTYGSWNLRPEFGFSYNIKADALIKSIDNFDTDLQGNTPDGVTNLFDLTSSALSPELNLGVFGGLSIGYQVSDNLDLFVAGRYYAPRSLGSPEAIDIAKSISSMTGIRFRF